MIGVELHLDPEDFLPGVDTPSDLTVHAEGFVTPGLPGNSEFPPDPPDIVVESVANLDGDVAGLLNEDCLQWISEAIYEASLHN